MIIGLGTGEIYTILVLAVAGVCAYFCSKIAGSKGYSPAMFGVLGFLFSFIMLIIVFVMPDKADQTRSREVDAAIALEKYKKLLDDGVITKAEFDKKKNELL